MAPSHAMAELKQNSAGKIPNIVATSTTTNHKQKVTNSNLNL